MSLSNALVFRVDCPCNELEVSSNKIAKWLQLAEEMTFMLMINLFLKNMH